MLLLLICLILRNPQLLSKLKVVLERVKQEAQCASLKEREPRSNVIGRDYTQVAKIGEQTVVGTDLLVKERAKKRLAYKRENKLAKSLSLIP